MNLIKDKWLPVVRDSGKNDTIAPWQIAEKNDRIIEIRAPRPDFQGALYQFLIGLLQTCFAPEDHDEWIEYWEEMPDAAELKEKFEKVSQAFELDISNGPAFMQDYDLEKANEKPIALLLIEQPGRETIKNNSDHFIKRNTINKICLSCAATALFTLQINAPSGGKGHRVSLRGGGPLTTLVRPAQESALWQKIWLNISDAENFTESVSSSSSSSSSDVFPWMAPTRTSEPPKGLETGPADVHELQTYWGMPRRIRLRFNPEVNGECDICKAKNKQLITKYSTQNYGVNYAGEWIHTLTPYRFDKKKEKPPFSIKGQNLGYQHWLGLAIMNDPAKGEMAAKVVRLYLEERARYIEESYLPVLWAFGYFMDKNSPMKARCWYDHTMPLFRLDKDQQNNIMSWASELIESARDTAEALRSQVKAAWFRRPKDNKGDMSVVSISFWQQSENAFYQILERMSKLPGNQGQAPPELYDKWVKAIRSLAYRLFDEWALESPAEDMDMKRITSARRELEKKLNTSKIMKSLTDKAKPE